MNASTQERTTKEHAQARIIGVERMFQRDTAARGVVDDDKTTHVTAMLDQARAALQDGHFTEAEHLATDASRLLNKVVGL